MNVQSLCLVSSMPRYPQALQEVPIVCFLGLTCCKDNKINYFVPKKTATQSSTPLYTGNFSYTESKVGSLFI